MKLMGIHFNYHGGSSILAIIMSAVLSGVYATTNVPFEKKIINTETKNIFLKISF